MLDIPEVVPRALPGEKVTKEEIHIIIQMLHDCGFLERKQDVLCTDRELLILLYRQLASDPMYAAAVPGLFRSALYCPFRGS